MNRLTKAPIISGLITITVLIAVIIGCSDDIVLPELPTLSDSYVGRYNYVTNYGAANQQTETFDIIWKFSDQNYWMSNADEESDAICEPSGIYILADGVEIVEKEEGCAGAVSDPAKNPSGVFSLRQPGDSVVMMQIIDDVCKEILLIPAGN